MSATLAEVLHTFEPAYLRQHTLSTPQARAWRAIVACRTPALGGQLQRCDQCAREQRLFHSCLMGSVSLRGVRRPKACHDLGLVLIRLPI
jgi:hypothetical protein